MKKNKVLIIRFSSFGDIIQCSSVVEYLLQVNKEVEIDWLTRSEFAEIVGLNHSVSNVISFNRKSGLVGLFKLAYQLRKRNYTLIYDAHNNIRSTIIYFIFKLTLSRSKWITRSKDRLKRILLFNFRINKFPKPFKGIDSFLNPLIAFYNQTSVGNKLVNYEFKESTINKISELIYPEKKIVTIVPSAAWEMKRWPIEYWKELIKISGDYHIYILGGKEDTFCEDLALINQNKVTNLAGKLSLIESCAFVSRSDVLVSADTGLLHVADVLGIKGISLMGPTAFGFTKSNLIKTLEVNLNCRPCTKDGRGKCSQNTYQKCLVDITPHLVQSEINKLV